jgi:hypothetical protein
MSGFVTFLLIVGGLGMLAMWVMSLGTNPDSTDTD